VKRGFLTCRDIFSRIISQKSISLRTHIIFLLLSLQIQICVGYIKREVICEELLKLRNAGLYCNNLYLSVKVCLQISLVRKLCISKLFEDTAHLHRHSLSFSLLKFNTPYSFSQPLFTSMVDSKQVHKRLKFKQYFSILFSTEWRQSIRVRETFRRRQVPDPSETVRGRPASAHPTVQPIRSGCYC
jgi:hypothetical protein